MTFHAIELNLPSKSVMIHRHSNYREIESSNLSSSIESENSFKNAGPTNSGKENPNFIFDVRTLFP